MKLFLRDYVRGKLEVIECRTLEIEEFSLERYDANSNSTTKNDRYLYIDGDLFIKEIQRHNGEFLGLYSATKIAEKLIFLFRSSWRTEI